jgi:hypothetical protein
MKVLEQSFPFEQFLIKGVRANGVRLSKKPIQSLRIRRAVVRTPEEIEVEQIRQLELDMGNDSEHDS